MLSYMFTERRVFYTWWNCLLLQPTKYLAIKLHTWQLCSTQSSWGFAWLGHFLKACSSVVITSGSFEAVESQEKLKLKITPKYNIESILPLILKARESAGGHNTSFPARLWLGGGRVIKGNFFPKGSLGNPSNDHDDQEHTLPLLIL